MGRERGVPPRNKAAIHIEPAVINVSCYRRASEYFHLRASAPRLASRRRIYTPVNTTPFSFFFSFFFARGCPFRGFIRSWRQLRSMRSSRAARKRERKKTGEEGEGGWKRSPVISRLRDNRLFRRVWTIRFDRRAPIFFCDRIGRFRRNLVLDVRPSNLDYRFAVHTCE